MEGGAQLRLLVLACTEDDTTAQGRLQRQDQVEPVDPQGLAMEGAQAVRMAPGEGLVGAGRAGDGHPLPFDQSVAVPHQLQR